MEAAGEGVDAPWPVRGVYYALCAFLDAVYGGRPIQRFWFLETVARIPYISAIVCLHLLESLGWWRAGVELRAVHFAEELNELHHLQIMESLGGDSLWLDRVRVWGGKGCLARPTPASPPRPPRPSSSSPAPLPAPHPTPSPLTPPPRRHRHRHRRRPQFLAQHSAILYFWILVSGWVGGGLGATGRRGREWRALDAAATCAP